MINQELEKEEKRGEVRIEEYNPTKTVRLSTDLFNVSKTISKLANSHAVKLLYAIRILNQLGSLRLQQVEIPSTNLTYR